MRQSSSSPPRTPARGAISTGLASTLYHAITGRIPPSAIDRMLHDKYEPLSELQPDGYDPALLMGIDKAMAFRTDDRPQSVVDSADIC